VITCASERIMSFRPARHAAHHTAAFILANKFIPSRWFTHNGDKAAIGSRALKVSLFSQGVRLFSLRDEYLEHFKMETFSFQLVDFFWTQEKSKFNIRITRRALHTLDHRPNIITVQTRAQRSTINLISCPSFCTFIAAIMRNRSRAYCQID